MLFVDFRKAFDLVHREGMKGVMRSWGFEESLLRVIEELYGNETGSADVWF